MSDGFVRMLKEHEERAELLLAAYEALPRKEREHSLLVSYRCRDRRCEVLAVWLAAGLHPVRLRPYKLSPTLTAATSPEARRKRTTDGRHWPGRVLILDELAEWGDDMALPLNCDHLAAGRVVRIPELLADVARATPGTPVRRVIAAVGDSVS